MTDLPASLPRREMLLAAAGLGLSFALPAMELRAAQRRGAERPKSLLIVWLDGGPSQLETWDPHPGGRSGGPTRSIETTVRGLKIAEYFPRMAGQMHRLSLVRSLVSKEGDHGRAAYYVRTGYRPEPTLAYPSLGSIVARERPGRGLEIPQFISLGYSENASRGGYLGGQYDAFVVRDPGDAEALKSRAGDDRQQRRLNDLAVVTRAFARRREDAVRRTLFRETLESAVKMMTSEQLGAFDASGEPQAVRAAYGETQVGRACLVARRLIETGVRVVEVAHGNYDSHENNFQTHRTLAGELDPALSALIGDLHDRDLLNSTAVLCLGEFGRTPRVNAKEGRDHWPGGFSCLLGGGGLAGGAVIGETDPDGERHEPADAVSVPDLVATVLKALQIDPQRSVISPIGRPVKFSAGQPVGRVLAS